MSRAGAWLRQPLIWIIALLLPAGLLLLFAAAGGDLSLLPAQRVVLDPHAASARGAELRVEDGHLRVTGGPEQGRAEVAWQLPDDLTDIRSPALRLRIDGASALHSARVLLQHGEQREMLLYPGHLQGETVLPLAPGQTLTRPARLRLILVPPDSLPEAAAARIDLRVLQAAIETPSLAGRIRALAQFWFGYRPWNGRSNHTSGFEHGGHPPPGFQALIAAWLAAALLLLAVFRRRRWLPMAGRLCLLAVLVLAAEATWQHLQRAHAALAVAQVAARSGLPTSAMPALEAEISALREAWRADPPQRVIVWGAQGFFREYPAWLLREFNVASLVVPGQLAALADAQPAVLILAGRDGWLYDAGSGTLSVGGEYRTQARPGYRGRWVSTFLLPPGAGR